MLKMCVICGSQFDARNSAITCGPPCSKKRRTEHKIEYYTRPKVKEHKRLANKTLRAKPDAKEHAQFVQSRWYLNNRERKRLYNANWQASNKEQLRQKRSEPSDRERTRINSQNRRARKHELPGNYPQDGQWQECLNYFNGCCAVCGRQLNDIFGEFTAAMDHWIPLSYEGDDNPGTVATNIVPLCHGVNGCNNSKSNKLPGEWLRRHYTERQARKIEREIQAYFESVKS